jgi:glycogen operon protein
MYSGGVLPADPRYLGASETAEGVNFAIWAAAADKVELCLIDEVNGKFVETRHELIYRDGPIFHGYIPGIRAGQRYGYRVYGEWNPEQGWRFNPNKILLDPYTHATSGELKYVKEIYGHDAEDALGNGNLTTMSTADNLGLVPLSVVSPNFPEKHRRINTPWTHTVIYEAHVRGLTAFNGAIPENERGTYKALAHPSTIAYLKELGITALELQPIHQFVTEPAIHFRGRQNYWGYNALAFSAPHNAYSATGDPITELRDAVHALHDAGIEVILDVVYNHTVEGGPGGPQLSFKGIDSKTFYRRVHGDIYDDVTGCGNTIDVRRPFVVRMIIDSLRWWSSVIGIDGFRFDLAAALARSHSGIDGISALMVAIVSDPLLRERKIIAEPWDAQGYALGVFPSPWREWNDQYRDMVRNFWLSSHSLGDKKGVGPLATRISGSHDIFRYRGPTSSINFVTAHDGLTLADLTAYEGKYNDANGEDNRDGTSHNFAWNVGVEGPSHDTAILHIRLRLMKSILTTLILAAGVPMILMGDEYGRTQHGSNNAFTLPVGKKNEELHGEDSFWGGWAVNWTRDEQGDELFNSLKTLIEIRQKYLANVAKEFFTGEADLSTSRKDLAWFNGEGQEMHGAEWDDPSLQFISYYVEASANQGLMVSANSYSSEQIFTLPESKWGTSYRCIFDSAEKVLEYSPQIFMPGEKVILEPHSVRVFIANLEK